MQTTEQKIGYDRIRAQTEARCTTQRGVQKFAEEGFSRSANIIASRLRLADQMRLALTMESGFPVGEYTDTDAIVRKAAVEGAFLNVEELLALRRALETMRELAQFFAKTDENAYPDLKRMMHGVSSFPEVVVRIDAIVDRFGQIKDNASPELHALRKAIREREGRVVKKLREVLAKAQGAGIVDAEATVSIRDGRATIPVSAANKRRLPGYIHDESGTGRTFYVEPAEVVEINNELRELEYEERREVVRILTTFTAELRPSLVGIDHSGECLTTMDMIRAKARFAIENRCVMPLISTDGVLELRQARHPLLEQALRREGREIVPLNLMLTRQKHILVISGPNAGGKSVCLKTAGLLQWMFQCGMPVPALENSQMPIFDDIFIDIGDEQSIDNDLSTYSSHLLNMKRMLRDATRSSLVLIDEFGTGTEPVIGGAIAESILERLEARGCYGIITTHFSNLKYYAGNAEGVVNGAMMFDVENIRPLFRLEMGVPGSSFAIEIARKIGLPEEIIRSASEKAGSDHIDIERQLREIARDKRYWEQKRDRIRVTDKKVEELEAKYSGELATIKERRAAILRDARAEAERITAEANRQIESTIRVIRESQADKELTRLARRELDTFRESLEGEASVSTEAQARIDREMATVVARRERRDERKAKRGEKPDAEVVTPSEPARAEVSIGSKVRIEGQDTIGEVQSIKGRKASVAFGQLKTTVEVSRLQIVSNAEFKKQSRSVARPSATATRLGADLSQRRLNFRNNIDVRGMRAAEALEVVRDFVDDAIMLGVSQLSILHGKGTGALKDEIRRYLHTIDVVSRAEDEHPDRGGAGITNVHLDF
ncbi:MAG: Smr/MutS family protein [Rikenellaceae bacterium]|nr:Smr/MutS family protein [Rikenellaceae bacterium]MCL2692394.1 Smr/MutS family protein [Rikenellaceae bacterium]